jgi:hypothetical protein
VTRPSKASKAVASPSESEKGPAVAAVAPHENNQNQTRDCGRTPVAGQALRVIEGEGKAVHYLARLQAQQVDPDELALIVSMLYGATLRGFCRVLAKAIGAQHA